MLRQLFILLLLFIASACAKDSESLPQMDFLDATSSGMWHLSEIETGPYGKRYWVSANGTAKDIRIILQDGTMLTSDSLQVCCAPKSYKIGNTLRDVPEPAAKYINTACAVVNCETCLVWEMDLKGDELIITYCKGEKFKYVRR
ncbi:MAG TPA: hypothetical protein VGN64_02295 [Dyadobacter sp.]|jgi:hypothetical protein|nr:hypothetical protein [Dyadobacter sp.]